MPLNGNRVKELREAKGMTQKELGEALGVALIVLVDQLVIAGTGLTPKLKKDLGADLSAEIEAAYKTKRGLTPALRERIYYQGVVSQPQIRRWEGNKTDVSGTSVSLLAIALDASTDHLLNLSPYVRLSLDKSKLPPISARLVEMNEAGTLPHDVRYTLGSTPALLSGDDAAAQQGPENAETASTKEKTNRKIL